MAVKLICSGHCNSLGEAKGEFDHMLFRYVSENETHIIVVPIEEALCLAEQVVGLTRSTFEEMRRRIEAT